MYTVKNYRTKKELKEDVKNGVAVRVFQPGPFGGKPIPDGEHCLEGPHYPEPHKWYAGAMVVNECVVKVK